MNKEINNKVIKLLRNKVIDKSGQSQLEKYAHEISSKRKKGDDALHNQTGDILLNINDYFTELKPGEMQELVDFIQYSELYLYKPLNDEIEKFIRISLENNIHKKIDDRNYWLKIAYLTRYLVEFSKGSISFDELKGADGIMNNVWWVWADCIADIKTFESWKYLKQEIKLRFNTHKDDIGLLLMRIPGWKDNFMINNSELFKLLLSLEKDLNNNSWEKVKKWIVKFNLTKPVDNLNFPNDPKFWLKPIAA